MPPANTNILYIVPNTTLPYGYELVNILGFPEGTQSRFRFKEEWVSEEVKLSYKTYRNKKSLIVLRDKEEAKFYPIRYGTIDKIRKVASTFYIEYSFGELISYESNASARNEQIERFNGGFVDYHDFSDINIAQQDMKPLVFGSNFEHTFTNQNFQSDDAYEKVLEKFQNIIEIVKEIHFYKGVEFIKIINLKEKNSGALVNIKNGYYELKELTDYVFSVYQVLPTKPERDTDQPRDISISSDNKYINIIKGKQRLVGSYDILNFIFRVNPNTAGVKTFIDINHHIKLGEEKFYEPNTSIAVNVKQAGEKYLLRMLLFSFACLLYFFPQLISKISSLLDTDMSKDISIIIVSYLFVVMRFDFKDYLSRK
jgi:hypothetical protein